MNWITKSRKIDLVIHFLSLNRDHQITFSWFGDPQSERELLNADETVQMLKEIKTILKKWERSQNQE